MANLNDLTNNSEIGSNGRYLIKSKKKEDALKASNQVWEGGLVIVVQYGSVNYVKITDGKNTFSQLASEGGATTVTSNEISDATAVGKSVLTASTATAARTAIGAGTSNVTIGTTEGTAADASTVLLPNQVLPTAPLGTSLAGGQVTILIEPGSNGQALVTEGGVPQWGNQTASSVGAVATNMVGVANGVASLGAGGFVPVGQLPNATGAARGVVLQGTAQADSVAADVPAMVVDFNALLAKLRTAGILAT